MEIGGAVAAMKEGKRVYRAGWNGRNMFLVMVPGSTITITADRPLGQVMPAEVGRSLHYLPHVDMFTAQGDMVPWLASQTDLLAEDWYIAQ